MYNLNIRHTTGVLCSFLVDPALYTNSCFIFFSQSTRRLADLMKPACARTEKSQHAQVSVWKCFTFACCLRVDCVDCVDCAYARCGTPYTVCVVSCMIHYLQSSYYMYLCAMLVRVMCTSQVTRSTKAQPCHRYIAGIHTKR